MYFWSWRCVRRDTNLLLCGRPPHSTAIRIGAVVVYQSHDKRQHSKGVRMDTHVLLLLALCKDFNSVPRPPPPTRLFASLRPPARASPPVRASQPGQPLSASPRPPTPVCKPPPAIPCLPAPARQPLSASPRPPAPVCLATAPSPAPSPKGTHTDLYLYRSVKVL